VGGVPALNAKEGIEFGFACFSLPFGSFALKRKTPSAASPARPPAQPAHLPAPVGGAQTKANAAHSCVGSSLTTANAAHSCVGSSLTTANAAHSCVAAPFAHARAILAYGRKTLAYGRGTLAYAGGTLGHARDILGYAGASPLGLWTVATPVPTPHIAAREPPAGPRTAPRPAPSAPPASLGPSGPIGPVPSGPGPGLSRVRKVHPRRLLPEPRAREAQRLPHAAPPRAS